jgi:tetratricopeptide (TPR) repeat protein
MLAEVAARLGRMQDAEQLLARCLELAPSFNAARHHYAIVLNRQNKPAAALAELERLLAQEPRNPAYRNLKAVVLARIGDFQESIDIYAELLARHPEHAKIWMSYGHALSTAGRMQDSIAAYRRSIALQPSFGEAYWSLANLKTFRFSETEFATLQAMAARDDLKDEDRFHFQFALGKALEDAGDYAASFEHYRQGNLLRRAGISYSPERTAALVRHSRQLFTTDFFAARAHWGSQQSGPIFIVGMPRAGSTLIEQILASHSRVEGTMELPHVFNTARLLANRYGARSGTAEVDGDSNGVAALYPQILADMQAADFLALGDQYLEQTRIYRHLGKPFFIDKLPNNFMHVGLIQLMLPRARIIDARRHPMACCFSGFKQHFARGQNYSYTLEEIGHYYCQYVQLMAHFDAVLPGRVHRVIYEDMIGHTEAEVRRLLAYCGLEFEPGCLRFYENERAVKTASAQQVRQPIFREGIDHWRHFEPWLAPLATSLGAVLVAYPGVPEF